MKRKKAEDNYNVVATLFCISNKVGNFVFRNLDGMKTGDNNDLRPTLVVQVANKS